MVDTEYLDRLIEDSGKTITHLAKKCGISRANFYMKKNGEREFTESEATSLCDELNITSMAERRRVFLP